MKFAGAHLLKSPWTWAVVACALAGLYFVYLNTFVPKEEVKGKEPKARSQAQDERSQGKAAAVNSTGKSAVHIVQSPATATADASERPGTRSASAIQRFPEGTPVITVLAALRGAADGGDRQAACRVGVELARCARLFENTRIAQNMRSAAANLAGDPVRGQQARHEADDFAASLQSDQRLCEGVAREQTRGAWRYLYQAATAGSATAMSKFVRDPGLSIGDTGDAAEGWAVYKREAPKFLWRAIQDGDVMALYYGWATAASGQTTGGRNVFAHDPYMALIYGNAAAPLVDPDRQIKIQKLNASLAHEIGAERSILAAHEAAALRERFFIDAATPNNNPDDGAVVATDCGR